MPPQEHPTASSAALPASPRPRRRWRWALAVVAVAAFLLAFRDLDLHDRLRHGLSWIAGQGAVGMMVFFLLYVFACVLLLPGSLLTLGAGSIYGLEGGIPLVSLSAIAGATAAFLVARHVARGWVTRKLACHPRFQALDEAVAREGWKIVGLTRLSPLFPFSVLNYLYGLTGVSLRDYVLASWIGMLPGTILYVYLGSLLRDIADLGTRSRTRTPAEWTFYAVGLLATILVTAYITRLARQALSRRLETH